MKVLLIGCIDSEAISNILSLRNPGNDWAAPIRVMFTLVSIAQALGRDQSTVAARTADRIRNGLPPDWDLEAVFDNGWPRVNQGRLPCAGTIILLNLDKGTYRATNRNFFPECG